MAARLAAGRGTLADLIREQQDLRAQRNSAAKNYYLAKARPQAAAENVQAADELNSSIKALESRIAAIDERSKREFPEYTALSASEPLSIAFTQSQLHDGEALVQFLDLPGYRNLAEETFIFVITKTDARWVRSELGTASLQREVAALRCGLDYHGNWDAPGSSCADLLSVAYSEADHERNRPLPFDLRRAHALYTALFGQIADLVKDKHLLIVPSGPLTQLPFQVLVAMPPASSLAGVAAFRKAAWLGRRNAISVLPAVSSLKALRTLAKESHATNAYIGFGNPLLEGNPADASAIERSKFARERTIFRPLLRLPPPSNQSHPARVQNSCSHRAAWPQFPKSLTILLRHRPIRPSRPQMRKIQSRRLLHRSQSRRPAQSAKPYCMVQMTIGAQIVLDSRGRRQVRHQE